MLNNVVLPAPLGPISPTISPAPTLSETSESAFKPPKRLEMPRNLQQGLRHDLSPLPKPARKALAHGDEAARLDQNNDDEEHAEDELRQASRLRGEDLVREFFQRNDEERPQDRTNRCTDSADDRDHRHAHRNRGDAEDRVGIEEILELRVERSEAWPSARRRSRRP